MSKSYIAAIDDSGTAKSVVDWHGNLIPATFPFVGLASVLLDPDALDELNGRWNHLMSKLQRSLKTPEPPEVHLRQMWGKTLPTKNNPYLGTRFRDIRAWLTEARNIILSLMRDADTFSVYTEFANRESFAKGLSSYYRDPAFAPEFAFFRAHKTKGTTGALYKTYHSITSSPLVRNLADILWRIDEDLTANTNGMASVLVDRFSGTAGIDAKAVLDASKNLAGLSRIAEINQVNSPNPPISQVADFFAYSYNRLLLMENELIRRDAQFLEVVSPFMFNARSLDGWSISEPFDRPSSTYNTTLCVIYALARNELFRRDPRFVEEHMITVEEFHDIAKSIPPDTFTGISVIRAESLVRGT